MDLVSFFFLAANEMKSGVFNFIQRGGELKNVPNESLHKGISLLLSYFG